MTMTGRYDFNNNRGASKRRLSPGTPHLAGLFKRNGYRTGIIGKHQPIRIEFQIIEDFSFRGIYSKDAFFIGQTRIFCQI